MRHRTNCVTCTESGPNQLVPVVACSRRGRHRSRRRFLWRRETCDIEEVGVILGHVTNPSLRWGDQAPSNVDGARDRLLDAAEACFERFGIAKTTIEDVAKEASVSRATIYRYFAGRDAVVSGVILRETERYLERVRPRVESQPDLGRAILEFVEVTLRAAVRDETVGLLFTSDDGLNSVGIIGGASVALFEMVSEFLRPVFEARADEHLPGLSVEDASEWILRAILSLLTVKGPKRRTAEGLDTYLRRFLLPAILRPTSS